MNSPITRRGALTAPLVLAGCRRRDPYFGKATPPERQLLVYEIAGEPSGFDPATSGNDSEFYVMPALFEGLVSRDPYTLQPRAALATHYQIDASLTEITFFLRGHPNPRGTKLPGTRSRNTALWSDGRQVTAHDFVCAWRRLNDPANGGLQAIYALANGKEVSEGKSPLESLGIHAVDDVTLQVILKAPAAHFLKMATTAVMGAVPRHAISEAGPSWTKPGRMVSCGPFMLHEWKPYERIVLRKNPRYYNARHVFLDEVVFIPITDGASGVNLYKTGNAYAMHGRAIPPLWIPALRERKDFNHAPAYRNLFYAFNTTQAPFDNPPLRCALQMAVNKHEITRFLGGGQAPAPGVVPPSFGYEGIQSVLVEAGGRVWNASVYDPEAARQLMRVAGVGPLAFDLTFPNRTRSKEIAQILQRQWRTNLGAEVSLVMQEWTVWAQNALSLKYRGVIESGMGADYVDPNSFLEFFASGFDGSGWHDPEFNRLLDNANAEANTAARMQKLAACEKRLLRAAPVLPLFFDSYTYLQKPYVSGLKPNVLDLPEFRDAWIDTEWRAS